MSVKIIASSKNWIEGTAVEQLEQVAKLPSMYRVVGMPDLHAGKGAPIGAVFASINMIYPHLVGNDIGCGMGLWQTNLRAEKLRLDKIERRLKGLDLEWDGDTNEFLKSLGIQATRHDHSLGTIGGGNHFAELQRLYEIHDREKFAESGINEQEWVLLVHSGSRGFGDRILRSHVSEHADNGIDASGRFAASYIDAHDHAVSWAQANRKLIAQRFLDSISAKGTQVLDICHNSVQRGSIDGIQCWFHRKGAAPTDGGIMVIPGSRGTLSYLVATTGDQSENLSTIAHGAGRKWKRSDCRARLEERFNKDQLTRTELGGRVICTDKDLLYEEAPQAYKNIDVVVSDLVEAGLVKIVATFAPLVTYKTSKTVPRS